MKYWWYGNKDGKGMQQTICWRQMVKSSSTEIVAKDSFYVL